MPDPARAGMQVGNTDAGLQDIARTGVNGLADEKTYDELRTERRAIGETLKSRLDQSAERWGIRKLQAQIRDIARA